MLHEESSSSIFMRPQGHGLNTFALLEQLERILIQSSCFAGTVLKLGTEIHHDAMLDGIDRVEPTGCFALTELGFGKSSSFSSCN